MSAKIYVPIIVGLICWVVFFALGILTSNYFRGGRR